MNKYRQIFNRSNFIIINNFFKNIKDIVQKTQYLKKNVVIWDSPQDDGGNLFVTNKKRRAYVFFLEENNLADVLPANFKKNHKFPPFLKKRIDSYKECYKQLKPLLYNPVNTLMRILGYRRWNIVGITLFSVSPGSPEQEIHHDAPEETQRIFITIPLHDTPVNMGPTIFYDDAKLGDFRQKYMENEERRASRPYGNLGFLNEIPDRDLFKNAQYNCGLKLGDIAIHRDITWHSAGNNISNNHRELLFIVIDVM